MAKRTLPTGILTAAATTKLALRTLALVCVIALLGQALPAGAQGVEPDPDVGTLFLDAYVDRDGDGSVPEFTISTPCRSADAVIPATTVDTSDLLSPPGHFVIRVFTEVFDDEGGFCDYTVTPTLDDGATRVYPPSVSFQFSNGPYAEAYAQFSVLGPETTGAVRVGMSAWAITLEEYEARDWPSSSTWTFEGFPDAWVYEITSDCIDGPRRLEVPAITEVSPTYGSEAAFGGLPLFAADGSECLYATEPLLPPGFVVARQNGYLEPHSLLPQLVVGPSFLVVRSETPVLCRDHIVTVDLAAGDLPTDDNDVILGTPGDDVILAGGGDDIVCGGDGNDLIRGQDGNDTIYGDAGDDLIRGSKGDDKIFGGAGRDNLSGSTGNDEVWGQDGDDPVVRGGTGDDIVNGGAGNDTIVAGNGGRDMVSGASGDDKVTGGPRPDQVDGGEGDDEVKGNGGADTLRGGPGNDSLFGGPQPDMLDGGDAIDACNGGTEVDTTIRCESLIAIP